MTFRSARRALLLAAALALAGCQKADDKPPFVDGCLFASLFEGPKAFKVGTAVAEGSGSKVKVHFTADEGVAWDDEVIVVKEDGRDVIDDVLLSGIGQFNPPGRLSTNLASRGE